MKKDIIIGAEEWCAFPNLSIPAIKARVDTGARTSSLHAFNIQTFRKGDQLWASFEVHPIQDNRRTTLRCEAEVCDRRLVKSSSGVSEKRYVIKTLLEMGNEKWEIEVTLSNRDAMGYRMLLGREAIQSHFLVNPNKKFLLEGKTSEQVEDIYQKVKTAKTGLTIGVLASNPSLYSNERLITAGEERGHKMIFLDIKQCYIKLDAENPEVHYRGGAILHDIDAIIPRIRPSVTFYGAALTRQFESMGVYTQNTAQAITQSRDKLYSLQLLIKRGINIPTTGFANSPIDTDDLIEMVGGAPLIVKLLEGTQGTGVILAESNKAAEGVINAIKSLKANLLVQEYIAESKGKDIRCFVIDNKVIASIQRQAQAGEFRANIHKGGSASYIKITAEERKMALLAAKTLGLAVAGVDIIRSEKGPLLLEVNSSPGLEGIEGATGKDIAREMILAIEKKLNWTLSD